MTEPGANSKMPYQLMCVFLWGSHESVSVLQEPGRIMIDTGAFCHWQHLGHSRLRIHLKKCEELGMIGELRFSRGFSVFKICKPALDRWEEI